MNSNNNAAAVLLDYCNAVVPPSRLISFDGDELTLVVNQEDLATHMEKECMWRHYNLSTQRLVNQVDPYGL